jgi:predicted transcriptional regulator
MVNYKRELNSRRLAWCKKNRSHFEIIASILEAIKNNGKASSRYSLMKHAGVNSAQLKEYLESLAEIGFVETDTEEDRTLYRASEKALDFLRQYYVLAGMLLSTHSCGDIAHAPISGSNGPFTLRHLGQKLLR